MGMKITQRSFSNQSKFDLSKEMIPKNGAANNFYKEKVKLQIENPSSKNSFQAKIQSQNHSMHIPLGNYGHCPSLRLVSSCPLSINKQTLKVFSSFLLRFQGFGVVEVIK